VTREFESKSGTGKTPAGRYGIRRRAVEKRFVRFGLAVFQDFALKRTPSRKCFVLKTDLVGRYSAPNRAHDNTECQGAEDGWQEKRLSDRDCVIGVTDVLIGPASDDRRVVEGKDAMRPESAESRDDPVTHNLKGDVDRGQQIGRGRGCRYQEEEACDPGKVRRGDDRIVGSTNFSCGRRNQGPRIARRI
jgi:hypothetical protein